MPKRRSANRGTLSDGVAVLAARVFASQSWIPFAVRRVGRFCFVWTTPTYRRLQRRGTLLRLTCRLSRGGGIYTGGISSTKNPHGAGLQYEFVCGKKVLPQGGGVQVGQRYLSTKSVATRRSFRLARCCNRPKAFACPACLLRPLNAGNKRYCFSDMPTFVGRLLLWRRHWSFVFPNALTCAVGD